MGITPPQSSHGSAAVGVIVAILIIGAVGVLGYYQFAVVGTNSTTTTTTSSGPTVTCPGPQCANVSIPSGASSPPPGWTSGQTTYGYSPDSITVVIGINNTLFWTNNDASVHTVTSATIPAGAQAFDSGNMNQGDTFQVTLTVPGTYLYRCTIHPWMWGTVVVLAAGNSGSSSSSTTAST